MRKIDYSTWQRVFLSIQTGLTRLTGKGTRATILNRLAEKEILHMVVCGIGNKHLLQQILNGKRIGFAASIASIQHDYTHAVHYLEANFNLVALYGPEHGFWGDQEAGQVFDHGLDQRTKLPVYSLYRKGSQQFDRDMLESIDTLVYDMQDVGTRCYTFLSTLLHALQACSLYKKELVILDRPNPLGGTAIEGILAEPRFLSFVGCHTIPMRHGLTAGEFALMANDELEIGCNLTVVPCLGWNRSMLFAHTGLPWVPPSPNIPSTTTALAYAGICLLEGTNVSEGRGTASPFVQFGAPWIHSQEILQTMNEISLEGIRYTETHFTPTISKYSGQLCHGLYLHITNTSVFQPTTISVALICMLNRLYPDEFKLLPPSGKNPYPFFDLLVGSDLIETSNFDLATYMKRSSSDSQVFHSRRIPYLLYSESDTVVSYA